VSKDLRTASDTLSGLADGSSVSTDLPVAVSAGAKPATGDVKTWATAPQMADPDLGNNVATTQTATTA
jgi:hypothetical protein